MSKNAEHYKYGDIVKEWDEEGVKALVIRSNFSFCAYIGVPEGHKYYGKHYSTLPQELEPHGGFTFADSGGNNKRSGIFKDGYWYFGWDYSHYTDRVFLGGEIPPFEPKGMLIDWMDTDVIKEAEQIIRQFNELTKNDTK